MMTLMIVSIPIITIRGQLTIEIVNLIAIKIMMTTMTLEDRVMEHINVKALTFEGHIDPWIFTRWIRDIDHFFN
jgi:hypothetical protein